MWKKSLAVIFAVIGLASFASAGTEVIRDYGRDQYNSYAPAPPPPLYYAPPPPVGVVVYPRPFFFGFGFHHRYYPHRVFVRRHF